jgi:hypothetical protein
LFKGSRHKRFQKKKKKKKRKRSEKERKKEKKKKKTEFKGAPRSGSQDNQFPG